MFAFASVECETVCQSSVLSWRLPVLPIGGHDGADVTYSYSSFGSYRCSSCFEVVMLRYRMDIIVDHLNYIKKLLCA
jgi:hypothetical protein